MIELMIIGWSTPPETVWLSHLQRSFDGVHVGQAGPIDDGVSGQLKGVRGLSVVVRQRLAQAEWCADVTLRVVDDDLEQTQRAVMHEAIAAGYAVFDVRARTVTWPEHEWARISEQADSGPIWDHLPISDPNVPRNDVPLSDVVVAAHEFNADRLTAHRTGTVSPIHIAFTVERPQYAALVGIVAAAIVANAVMLGLLGSLLRSDGDLSRILFNMGLLTLTTMTAQLSLACAVSLMRSSKGGSAHMNVGALLLAGLITGAAIGVGLILIIPGVVLYLRWALVPVVIVRENVAVRAAFGRSNDLMRGWSLRFLGLMLMVGITLLIASIAIHQFGWAGSWGSPTWEGRAAVAACSVLITPIMMLWLIAVYDSSTASVISPSGGE